MMDGGQPIDILRSNRVDVRNPMLALPAAARLKALPPEVKAIIYDLLMDLSRDAAARAQHCWRKNKAPMAAYWKVVSVYAKHAARIAR